MMSDLQQQIVEYIPRLRRYAHALMHGDKLAADDLVQDCLERALSRLHHWRRGSDLRAWLFTIMHNVYVNQLRRLKNGPQFVELQHSNEPINSSGSHSGEQNLALRDLNLAIGTLSPDQREILLLVSLEGLRYGEVAKILKIPEGTVMSRLSRARKQLRNIITENETPDLWRVK